MGVPTAILFVVAGLLTAFFGGWAVFRNNGQTPRFAAGIGSGYSPGVRRAWGVVFVAVGVSAVVGGMLALAR